MEAPANEGLASGRVEFLGVFGDDLTVVNAARVSLAKESRALSAGDVSLLKYLAEHEHISPFFHPQLRLRIRMPIFVAREWYRHTVGFARNEVSRRYVDTAPEAYVPPPDAVRARAKSVKQGSSAQTVPWAESASELMASTVQAAHDAYSKLIDGGVAPEVARMVLPQSMYTEFIETASLYGYARLCRLRTASQAQREIREYAGAVAAILRGAFPVSIAALEGRLSTRGIISTTTLPVRLIGVGGAMGAGKDTLADAFCERFPEVRRVRFATGVRLAAEILSGVPVADTWSDAGKARPLPRLTFTSTEFGQVVAKMVARITGGVATLPIILAFARILCEPLPSPSGSEDSPDQPSPPLRLKNMTVGRLLQLIGTECFRDNLGPDVWVNFLLADWSPGEVTMVVDTRYPNEAEAIRRLGGAVIRVVRKGAARADGRHSHHASEVPLDPALVDLEIANDGVLADEARAHSEGDSAQLTEKRLFDSMQALRVDFGARLLHSLPALRAIIDNRHPEQVLRRGGT